MMGSNYIHFSPHIAAMRIASSFSSVLCFSQKLDLGCISFRCKITVSLAQGAVNDAEADVADPVFVRSTIAESIGDALYVGSGPASETMK